MSRSPFHRLQSWLSQKRRIEARNAFLSLHRRSHRRLGMERLEPRQLLAIDFPSEIVVGRTLSAYSVNDVQNNQLKLTYTIYNQREIDIAHVSLADTLKPGVSFVAGSQTPTQAGQVLTWDIGSIPAYGRRGIEVTIALASGNLLQLDEGAHVFGSIDGTRIYDDAPAAELRNSPILASELTATPDANSLDPVIQEKAAELDYSPERIFAYLKDKVGFQSYVGSMRGARGTLWANAGNALDEASLGVALFRASGIPARYAHGTLSDAHAQELIRSMFAEPTQIVGYLPAGAEVSDPVHDSRLLAETRDHYWFQVDLGAGYQNADTSGLQGGAIGVSFTESLGTFNEVAESLRHKVRVSLDAESYGQAAGAFNGGNGTTTQRVLDRTWNVVELVGKPLSVSHFVTDKTLGGFTFLSRSLTYNPYFLVGDTIDPAGIHDEIFTGLAYQELLTNFPLGSQILMGLKLSMDLTQPDGQFEHQERMLVDRLGYANRHNSATANFAVDANGQAALSPLDFFTLNVLPGETDQRSPVVLTERVQESAHYLNQFSGVASNLFPADYNERLREFVLNGTRLISQINNRQSDAATRVIGRMGQIAAYEDRTRLVLVVGKNHEATASASGSIEFSIDLRRDSIRAIAAPGQSIVAVHSFQFLRGMVVTEIERDTLSRLAPPDLPDYTFNTNTVLFAAATQQIPILTLNSNDLPRLSTLLHASAEAHARISDALNSGRIVIVPERPVRLGTAQRTAWYEIDPTNSETISVGENGDHVAALEYAINTLTFGFVAGVAMAGFNGVSGGAIKEFVNTCMALETIYSGLALFFSNPTLPQAIVFAVGSFGIPASAGFLPGLGAGWNLGLLVTGQDPPAEGQFFNIAPDHSTQYTDTQTITVASTPGQSLRIVPSTNATKTNQNTSALIAYSVESDAAGDYAITATAPLGWTIDVSNTDLRITPAPGTQSGTGVVRLVARSKSNSELVTSIDLAITVLPTVPQLEFDLTLDPLLTVPFLGAQLPTAYRARIRNLGPDSESYSLTVSNVTPGWEVILSDSQTNLGSGETGVRGVYLRPNGAVVPTPGTSPSFTLTATSIANSIRTATRIVNASLPNVEATVLLPPKLTLSAIPNSVVTSSIVVFNAGNTTDTVTLSAGELPAGVTINGLPMTLTLQPGHSIDVDYSLSIAESVPLNTTAYLKLSLDKKPFATSAPVAWIVAVHIAVPGADAIVTASETAAQLGRPEFSTLLEDLGIALTALVKSPTDRIANSQSVAALDAIIQLVQADSVLAELYTDSITQARNLIASASTTTDVQSALNFLAIQLASLSQTLIDIVEHQFTFGLASNVVTALPGVPAVYPILLENQGTKPTTFDLSVGGFLPFGTKVEFSRTSVTLQPGERLDGGTNGVSLKLTFAQNSIFPTGFTVIATPQEASLIRQQVTASVSVRAEFVQVSSVTPSPAFTEPGGVVAIGARILNVVNREQMVSVSYRINDASGTVIFNSSPQDVLLQVQSSLMELALTTLDTSALARGDYSITVLVKDEMGELLPGGEGKASFLIGTPVSATLSVTPDSLIATDSTVTNALRIDSRTDFQSPLTLIGQVQTLPTATTILVRGELAYVAGTNGIDIVNITNPASPQVVGTFGQGLIVQGGFTVVRSLDADRILVATRGFLNASSFTLLTYNIANPIAPVLLGQSSVDRSFISDLFVIGNHAIATTNGVSFVAGNVISQFGDVISVDITNPNNSLLTDELLGLGADNFNQNGGELVDASTLYVASTTSSGGFSDTQQGVGLLRVIDYSDPNNLSQIRSITIPKTVQALEVAVDGNRALVVGSTGGWKSPFLGVADAQLTGRMTLTLLDITDRRNPVVLGNTLVSESLNRPVDTADGGSKLSMLALGNGKFAISRGYVNGSSVLLLADITGDDIVVASTPVPSLVNEMAMVNNKLYTTSQSGLLIYDIGHVDGTTTAVNIRVPNVNAFGQLNRVLANSFNIAPDKIVSGVGFDTLVWNRPFAFGTSSSTITWQTEVSGITPGESRDVTLGTDISFVTKGTQGGFSLPSTSVVGINAVSIDPASQSVAPGTAAIYEVTLSNPTNRFLSFNLSTSGVPISWVNLPSFVFVDANSTTKVPLRISAPANTPNSNSDFVVFASANGSVQGTAQGTLKLLGTPKPPDGVAHGVVAEIVPMVANAGQGTRASYVVRLTNTGSKPESFQLSSVGPAGITASFESTLVTVAPGTNNFQEVTLHLEPAVGTAIGKFPFTVFVNSTTSGAQDSDTDDIYIAEHGVSVKLDSNKGTPGDQFQVTISNTGSVTDTFELGMAGPAGTMATLALNQLTLAPNESQIVNIATYAVDFVTPGTFSFTVFSRSLGNLDVVNSDNAELTVPPSQSVATRFAQASKLLPNPGTADFELEVLNTGNTEDSYSANIISTIGPIDAILVGSDGQLSQAIPTFRLPGLGAGVIRVKAQMAEVGQGTFQVQIRSLTNNSVVSVSTATLTASSQAPVAIADTFSLVQAQQSNLDLLSNDLAFGFPLNRNSLQFRDGPSHATISLSSDGKVLLTPEPTYYGADLFSYRVADGNGVFSNWVTVAISINGLPIARDDESYVGFGSTTFVDVLKNDSDPDGQLINATIELLTTVDSSFGNVDVVNGLLRFVPSSTFDSSLIVQYRITDALHASSANASVLLGVYNQNPINPLDVDRDTFVSPLDVLLTINSMNLEGIRRIAPGNNKAPFYDVNADGELSPLDTLTIINYLNVRNGVNRPNGEGEQSTSRLVAEIEAPIARIDQFILELLAEQVRAIHLYGAPLPSAISKMSRTREREEEWNWLKTTPEDHVKTTDLVFGKLLNMDLAPVL